MRTFAALALLAIPPAAHAQQWQWAEQGGGSEPDILGGVGEDGAGNVYAAGTFRGDADFGSIPLSSFGGSDLFVAKYAPDGAVVWVEQAGGTDNDNANGLALGPAGDVYVVGAFQGTADIGGIAVTGGGLNDTFVARYASDGTVAWAESFAGTDAEADLNTAVEVAVNEVGDVIVAGNFRGTLDVGETTLTSVGDQEFDIYVAKMTSDGMVVWAQQIGGAGNDFVRGIAVGVDGTVYVAGDFIDTATLGAFTLTSAGEADVFLARYAPDGTAVWAARAGGASFDVSGGVGIDPSGDLLVTGSFQDTADFGSVMLTASGFRDAFVAKYTAEGAVVWGTQAGGTEQTDALTSNGIAVDAAGDVYITGRTSGAPTIGSDVLTALGLSDAYLAKYDADGAPVWAHRAGGEGDNLGGDVGREVAVGASGNVYFAGDFASPSADFGPFTLASAGGTDMFVAQLSGSPVAAEGAPSGEGGALTLSPVWPNPATDLVEAKLVVSAPQSVRVEVIDVLGRRYTVARAEVAVAGEERAIRVDISDLPSGLYTLRAVGTEGRAARPFTIIK